MHPPYWHEQTQNMPINGSRLEETTRDREKVSHRAHFDAPAHATPLAVFARNAMRLRSKAARQSLQSAAERRLHPSKTTQLSFVCSDNLPKATFGQHTDDNNKLNVTDKNSLFLRPHCHETSQLTNGLVWASPFHSVHVTLAVPLKQVQRP